MKTPVPQIAFYELNPFPQRMISNKREHHQKVLKVLKDLINGKTENWGFEVVYEMVFSHKMFSL